MTILLDTRHEQSLVVNGDQHEQQRGEKQLRCRMPIVKKTMLNCAVDEDSVSKNKKKKQQLEGQDELRNVFLKMWDGKTLCWTVNPHDLGFDNTNDSILSCLQNKVLYHYPNESKKNFYFMYPNGKQVNYDTMMSNHSTNCTINVQYRNNGGCFMLSLTVLTIIMAAIVGSTCTCGVSLLLVPLLMPLLFILPLFCL